LFTVILFLLRTVQILTAVFEVDLEISLPWGKATVPFFKSSRFIAFKNILGLSLVVFCACEGTQLLSVVLCMFRAVHKSDFRLVVNEITTVMQR